MGYSAVNILDLIEIDGDGGKLKNVISSFKCPINQEIEDYLHKSAVIFAKKKITINYLLHYSNCKYEFKKRIKKLIISNIQILSKYNGRHSFSSNPIQNLF